MDSGEISFASFSLKARAQAIKYFIWLLLALIPFFIITNLTPLLDKEMAINEAKMSKAYLYTQEEARNRSKKETQYGYFQYPVSQFIAVAWEYKFYIDNEESLIDIATPEIKILYDQLVLWLGLFMIALLSIKILLPSLSRLYLGPIKFDLESSTEISIDDEVQESQDSSAIYLFKKDAIAAERRAENIFARSTLLLTGGIIMSFVGVVIFYITLPEPKPSSTIQNFWPQIIRPTGVLIFIESIAWFLLRQYRSLIEDYKSFHKLHIKRSNYLAALILLDNESVTPEKLFLAASLVNEDLSGKLRNGETTEAIEGSKMTVDNPISDILNTIKSMYADK